jgi:hypothetical protein
MESDERELRELTIRHGAVQLVEWIKAGQGEQAERLRLGNELLKAQTRKAHAEARLAEVQVEGTLVLSTASVGMPGVGTGMGTNSATPVAAGRSGD